MDGYSALGRAASQGGAAVKNLRFLLVLGVLLAPNVLLAADDWRSWPMGERMKLSVGYYDADMNTRTTVSEVDGVEGTPIDFEDDLGLDDNESSVTGALSWRVFKRHTLNFNYYKLDRDANTTLDKDIVFNGVTVPAGEEANTFFNLKAYEGSYSYSIMFDETKNLWLGLGVSVQDLEFGLENPADPGQVLSEDITAPLPTINLGFDYAITENWIVGLHAGYLDMDIDIDDKTIDGKILRGDAGIRWKVFNNMGLSASYFFFDVDAYYEDDDVRIDLDYDYKGPLLSLDLYF
jgi:hypothetical protein